MFMAFLLGVLSVFLLLPATPHRIARVEGIGTVAQA
jgi:hypothetical protein